MFVPHALRRRVRRQSARTPVAAAESLESRRLLTSSNLDLIELFTDADLTTPGLTGSYVNTSLRTYSAQHDWRETQTIAGQRIDSQLFFDASGWGARSEVGLTAGTDDNWQFFSVQWDGYIRVLRDGTRLQLGSDDGSRLWIDLNGDGSFDASGDEFVDNNWGTGQPLTFDGVSSPLPAGTYPVRVQFEEGNGKNAMQLVGLAPTTLADTRPLIDFFTDQNQSASGLTGSYIDASLRSTTDFSDWRQTHQISGTRTDTTISFREDNWGSRSEVGLTGGTDENWDRFSVQWDGFVQIHSDSTRLQSRSDDGSRFWVDSNSNGIFDSSELVDNGWGNGQAATYGALSQPLSAGLYPIRIQYEEGAGKQQMELLAVPDPAAVPQRIEFDVNALIYANHFTQPGGAASQTDREQFRDDVEAGLKQYLDIVRIASRGFLDGTATVTFSERTIRQEDYNEIDRGDDPPWLVLKSEFVDTLLAEDFTSGDAFFSFFMWDSSEFSTANFYHGRNFISMVGDWPGVAAHEFMHLLDDNLRQAGQPGMVNADDLGDATKYPHITTPETYNAGRLDWASIPLIENILALHENGDSLVDYRSLIGRFGTYQGQIPNTVLNPLVDANAQITVSAADAPAVAEGNELSFVVSLNRPTSADVTLTYSTSSGSAVSETDFVPQLSGQLTIAAGDVQRRITIETIDDQLDESTEDFFITLSNASGAQIGDGLAIGRIEDNDETPQPAVTGPVGSITNTLPDITWTEVEEATSYELWLSLIGSNSNPVVNPTVTETSYRLTNSLGIGRYRAWVRARLASGKTTPWATGEFQVSVAPVIHALPFHADNLTPTVSWDPVPGAVRYRVYVDNSTSRRLILDTETTETSLTLPSSLSFGVHRIWVRAIGASNYSAAWSNATKYSVGPKPVSAVSSTFDATPRFSWTSFQNVATYQLYVQRGSTVVINESGLTSSSYTPSSDLPTGLYRWWVRPTHSNGSRGAWSPVGELFIGGRPDVVSATVGSHGRPVIEWNPVDGAGAFEIYLFNDDGAGLVERVRDIAGTSFTANPIPDGEYRVWVKSWRENGAPGLWSRPFSFAVNSALTSVTVSPRNPRSPTFDMRPEFTWTAPAEASSFDIYLTNGSQEIAANNISQPSWTPDSPLATGVWNWWVRAGNAAGNAGPWSSRRTTDTSGRPLLLGPIGVTSSRTPTVTWTPVIGAREYVFQLDNVTTGENAVIRENGIQEAAFTTANELAPGTYRAWVRAISAVGSSAGPWSFRREFEVT